MRFSHIEVTNFRSFGPEATRIDFPDDENLVVVVGANNAGKSNLLEALRLVLGGRRRWEPTPSEFHRLDVTTEMRIELHLREPLLRGDVFGREDAVRAFYFRAWQSTRAPDKGQLKHEHRCLDEAGKVYNPPVAVKGSGSATPGAQPLRRVPPPAREVLPQLGPVHYLDPQMYRAFDTTGFGVLARLVGLYREDFRSTGNFYRYTDSSGQEQQMPSADAFEKEVSRLRDILSTPKLAEIEQALTKHLEDLLGPDSRGAHLTVALPSAEDLLADALRLQAQDAPDAPTVPVAGLGAGYQSLLRLAILRTYSELMADERRAVFLVEEPEAYLNPHLRRHFRKVLGDLADGGHDVFLTTHDPAFAPLTEYRTILRLEKAGRTTVAYRSGETLDFSYEAVAQKLRRGGNAEVLFATRAILCEGQDDVAAVRLLFEKAGVDLDVRSVSVLDCGGRENLPDYVSLLDALHIDLYVVSDGDATTIAEKPQVADRVNAVKSAAGERLFLFKEDLERALGAEKKSPNLPHIVGLVEALEVDGLPDDHEIKQLRDALREFVIGAPAPPVSPG